MAEICPGGVDESKATKASRSSRAAQRRRILLRRMKPDTEDSRTGEKRQKLEDCEDGLESSVDVGWESNDENSEGGLDGGEVGLRYGMASVCGRRRDMEDALAIQPLFCGVHYFGVYDGHGCSHVATKCGKRLHELVKEELENNKDSCVDWRNAMVRSFSRMDKEVSADCNKNKINDNNNNNNNDNKKNKNTNDSINGSGTCRCELRYPESDAVGSTAVTAVVTSDKIIVANCGDSRAVLCRSGRAIPLSTDHKPDRPDELSRIEAAGGRVIYWDCPRVLGVLAMSRAIGNGYLKPYVSSEPEVMETTRTEEDECLILASDGLWDVVSNETACGVARMCLKGKIEAASQICSGEKSESGSTSADKACSDASILLTKLALSRRSSDNVTVVVIDLRRDI